MSPRALPGPCGVKSCHKLGTHGGRCEDHKRVASDVDRSSHTNLRRKWQPIIDRGGVICRRCKQPIPPFDPSAWDVGDPAPKAPEHRRCNRATMGRDRA